MTEFLPATLLFLYLAVGVFISLWPILIWSHLREHTKYLKEIRDLLKDKRP